MEYKEAEEEDGTEHVEEVLARPLDAVDEPLKELSLEGRNSPIRGRQYQKQKGPCKRAKVSVCNQMYDF